MDRPSWDEYYLGFLIPAAKRSHDAQTKIGCVLVKDNTILTTGYNGFVRDIDDSRLPNTRPDKYSVMRHAEKNCLTNCCRLGKSTLDAVAYLPCEPCFDCYQDLYNAGIKRIVYSDIVQASMHLASQHELFPLLHELIGDKMAYNFIPFSS
jgi:dCMP deaminase